MPTKREGLLNVLMVLVTVCALGTTGLRLWDRFLAPPTDPLAPQDVENWRGYQNGGQRMGPSGAKVVIVEFSDFQCPFCRKAAGDLRALRAKYPGQVAVIYRHFPLPGHAQARPAAIAAQCAARAERFDAFHDLMFEHPDSLGKTPWQRYAQEAGVGDLASFNRCVSDSLTVGDVALDQRAGEALGVDGTPTFLINNLMIPGHPGAAKLEEYVRKALAVK